VGGRQVHVLVIPDGPLDVQEFFEILEQVQGADPDLFSQA
jgi:hypothetical protein